MSDKLTKSALLLALMYGMGWSDFSQGKPSTDELDEYLKIYNITLEEEYKKIQQKKCGLSARLRDEVIYRYEKAKEV